MLANLILWGDLANQSCQQYLLLRSTPTGSKLAIINRCQPCNVLLFNILSIIYLLYFDVSQSGKSMFPEVLHFNLLINVKVYTLRSHQIYKKIITTWTVVQHFFKTRIADIGNWAKSQHTNHNVQNSRQNRRMISDF